MRTKKIRYSWVPESNFHKKGKDGWLKGKDSSRSIKKDLTRAITKPLKELTNIKIFKCNWIRSNSSTSTTKKPFLNRTSESRICKINLKEKNDFYFIFVYSIQYFTFMGWIAKLKLFKSKFFHELNKLLKVGSLNDDIGYLNGLKNSNVADWVLFCQPKVSLSFSNLQFWFKTHLESNPWVSSKVWQR